MNCANHPDRPRTAFCQNCGKALCPECTRTVGTAVFCEPCLAARLAAAEAGPSSTPYGYVHVPGGPGPNAAPLPPGAPNPVLAGALGFIPGVGAMYNGQYAKGVVHLIVFAVLDSIAKNYGALHILVAGWVFYQVFEAYQTARARRDGTPLPNPFGLNDIGERVGFGKSWTATSAPYAPVTPVAPASAEVPMDPIPNGSTVPPSSSAGWTTPGPTYPYTAQPFTPVSPYVDPLAGMPPAPPQSHFPAGAVFLIGLGLFFFFMTSGWFPHFPIQRAIPFVLIAIGVWIFTRKMLSTGGFTDDGTGALRVRIFRAARGAVWVILVGVLFFLDSFYILSWAHSWPLFIIVAGVMTVLERAVANSVLPPAYAYATTPYTPAAAGPIAPVAPTDQEGR